MPSAAQVVFPIVMISNNSMKKLFAAVLVLAGISFWACQKEYSYETTTDTASTGAWEFKDSANTTYAGNPSEYYVDDTSNPSSAFMQYSGLTANQRGALSIGISFPTGTAAPGTYTSAAGQVDFLYTIVNGNRFKAESGAQFSTENITVIISQITDTSVTGTFSGVALDSLNRLKIVKEGKFTYKKRAAATTPTAIASAGTLGTSTDSCTGAIVSGTYRKAVAVTGTNTVTITANVTTTGTYTIYSDTLKGIYFRGTGTFATTGAQSVVIPAVGTPTDSGTVRFRIRYGTSSCTFGVRIDTGSAVVVVPPTGDYFPLTTNSNWSYNTNDSGSSTITDTTYTLSTGQTASVTGNTFNIFINDDGLGLDTSYYRKGSGLYYTTYNLSDLFGAGGVVSGIFLKDNVAVGTTWTDSYNITYNGLPAVVTGNSVILAKAVSGTVNTVSSTDIIKVRTTFNITYFGTTTTGYILENWFAKGIGLIYSKQNPVFIPLSTTQEIKIRRFTVL